MQAPPLQVKVFCLVGLLAGASQVVRVPLSLRPLATAFLSVVRDLAVTVPLVAVRVLPNSLFFYTNQRF